MHYPGYVPMFLLGFGSAMLLAAWNPLPVVAQSAELQPATSQEYDWYVANLEAELEAKGQSEDFLWVHGSAEKLSRVKSGEVVVAPFEADGDVEITGGVIHDWVGTVFIPGANIDRVLEVVRDYDSYKNRYAPEVVDSKILSGSGDELKVYLRLAKELFLTVVFNSEYDIRYRQINDKRWTTSAVSTKLVEVENPDTPQESEKPEGTGMGFLWRINTYFVFAELDGGVYAEMRSLSLSNTLSPGLWLLKPILAELPSQSVLATLEATRGALTE